MAESERYRVETKHLIDFQPRRWCRFCRKDGKLKSIWHIKKIPGISIQKCPSCCSPSRACLSSPRGWCTGRLSASPARSCRSWGGELAAEIRLELKLFSFRTLKNGLLIMIILYCVWLLWFHGFKLPKEGAQDEIFRTEIYKLNCLPKMYNIYKTCTSWIVFGLLILGFMDRNI